MKGFEKLSLLGFRNTCYNFIAIVPVMDTVESLFTFIPYKERP
jgi:hypothetical protein